MAREKCARAHVGAGAIALCARRPRAQSAAPSRTDAPGRRCAQARLCETPVTGTAAQTPRDPIGVCRGERPSARRSLAERAVIDRPFRDSSRKPTTPSDAPRCGRSGSPTTQPRSGAADGAIAAETWLARRPARCQPHRRGAPSRAPARRRRCCSRGRASAASCGRRRGAAAP
jgi:hypothetical protein